MSLFLRWLREVPLRLFDKLDLPLLLTPGAAEALAVKVYRQVRTSKLSALAALKQCLQGYQPPVSEQVLRQQMIRSRRSAFCTTKPCMPAIKAKPMTLSPVWRVPVAAMPNTCRTKCAMPAPARRHG